jgi:hypothetical protein
VRFVISPVEFSSWSVVSPFAMNRGQLKGDVPESLVKKRRIKVGFFVAAIN